MLRGLAPMNHHAVVGPSIEMDRIVVSVLPPLHCSTNAVQAYVPGRVVYSDAFAKSRS